MLKEEKLLKRFLKRKFKITDAIVVAFLITGSVAMALDITEDYTNTGAIVIENKGTEYEGINFVGDNINFTNNGFVKITTEMDEKLSDTTFLKVDGLKGASVKNTGTLLSIENSEGLDSVTNNGLMFSLSEVDSVENFGHIFLENKKENKNSNLSALTFVTTSNESIKNSGLIEGEISVDVATGVTSEGMKFLDSKVGTFTNEGVVKVTATNNTGIAVSNAFQVLNTNIDRFNNTGIISGSATGTGDSLHGRGIVFSGDTTVDLAMSNSGVISGYVENPGAEKIGYGLFTVGSTVMTTLRNNGVIKGSSAALYLGTTATGGVLNNGILAGRQIATNGTTEISSGAGFGTTIKFADALDADGNLVVTEIGHGPDLVSEAITVVNAHRYTEDDVYTAVKTSARDSYIRTSELAEMDNIGAENLVINGAGMNTGALIVDTDADLHNSVVNGYNTAVYLENESTLTLNNVILNGGGENGTVATVKGSESDNTLSLLGVTTVNGDINLGSGNDMLTVSNESLLNGSVFGGAGDDTLALGVRTLEKEKDGLNIFAGIDGFETIKTNGKVALFESAKVTGARDITLESGELLLRVDPTQRDIFDKITGHALYENSGVLSSTGGDLVIGLNGLGEDSLISMGDTTIAPSVDGKWWEVDDHLKTNSLVLDAKLTDDGDVAITVKELIPLEPPNVVDPEDPDGDGDGNGDDGDGDKEEEKDDGLFKKLNDIYASIVGAGEIGKLANTTLLDDKTEAEALEGLLVLLDQMYANTPYAYTLKASKDSMNLFKDNLSYLTIKPEEGKWITQGRAVYSEVNSESGTTLNGSYGFNSSHRDYETNSTISGGLASFEYGLSSTSSYGFALGGNNQKVKFRGSNSIDGSSVYLGTFLKKDVNNFKFKTGLAYQYSDMSVDRGISNGYDSFVNGANYDVNAGQFFLEGKYVIDIGDNTTIEPRMELVVTHVEQESISEKYGAGKLSMGVDKIGQTTTDVEMGVDFVKSVGISGGKINNILRLGIVTPMGIDEKPLAGHIVGAKKSGNKFEIRGIDTPSITGNVGYTFELEKDNGMLYNAGIDYKFVDKDRNFDLKLGVGYKF